MTPFIGQIQAFGFNFPPRGWAFCDGQLLAISSNTALFSLLGTTFGGDGQSTFGLPDLRGRSIVHVGNGPGLSQISWGQKAGAETISQIPAHTHSFSVPVRNGGGDETNPGGTIPASSPSADIYSTASPNASFNSGTTGSAGIASVNVRNPYVGIYVCIALTGIFPSRN